MKLPDEFPNEAFVQRCVERHFRERGFVVDAAVKHVDLVCSHPATGERWHVEAKGVTSATGLDFRTGLGQLLHRMNDETVKHGLAVPAHEKFASLIAQVSPWVRDRLGLHWLIVDPSGAVKVVGPKETHR
jgi:hypothetical protein